jgi:hypothetical protein
MDEVGSKPARAGGEQQAPLKAYSAPKLTPLGGIDSLVRSGPTLGADCTSTTHEMS